METSLTQINWLEYCKSHLRSTLRLIFVIINNVYCLPIYIFWMLFLYPLRKFRPQVYWKIEGICFGWLLSMVAMWSWSAGYQNSIHLCSRFFLLDCFAITHPYYLPQLKKVLEMGHKIEQCVKDRTLVIVNHQSTADVPFLMALFNAKPNILPNINWIMDYFFKYTNFGIVSAIHGDFFIVAGKESRDKSLIDLKRHLIENYLPRQRNLIVLFPEGGFLKNRKESSKRYALKNNLPNLENVTIPRFGAFQTIMDTLNEYHELQWVLDITVAYPKEGPLDLGQIIFGSRSPCNVLMFFRLYPISEVPKDSANLTNWLVSRFHEKDKILREYYEKNQISIDNCESLVPNLEMNRDPVLVRQNSFRFFVLHSFCIIFTYVNFLLVKKLFF